MSAERAPDGSYLVDPSELFRVFTPVPASSETSKEQRTQSGDQYAHLERRVLELEDERRFLRGRLEARDRDVERLTLLLTGPRSDEHQQQGSGRKWWAIGLGTVLALALAGWALFLVLRSGV